MIRLRLLGGASVARDDGTLFAGRAAQRHRLALLARLACPPGAALSREKLIGLLWPESDTERARNLLNVSVYELRKALGEDALISGGDELRVNPDAVGSDVADFEAAIARCDHEAAVALYRGPLLDGFFVDDAPEFERWVDGERARLAGAYARSLEALAEAAERRGDFRAAAGWWERRAEHDPYDSRVAVSLMRALNASGNPAGALHHASVHERLLQQELGLPTAPAVRALAERMRAEPPAAAPSPAPAAMAEPLVARADPAPGPRPTTSGAPTTPGSPGDARHRRRRRLRVASLALLGIAVIAALAWALWPAAPKPERSVVVLPFVNMSPDGNTEYFSDGLTEEVSARLSTVPALKVISRTSAMHYKGSTKPLRQIAEELGVANVLEGSVRREGGKVRITAQLIDAGADRHLWAQSYDRELVNVLGLQDEIAREVGRALEVTLGGGAHPAAPRGTRDPEAYELYLRGRYHWQKRTKDGHEQALAYFRRAIERDSTYADAYAGLASVYLTGYAQYIPGFADREADTYANLKWTAERAVALDDNSALAHRALATLRWWQRDWPGAERELLRTLELNPGDEQARNWYGALLGLTGRIDDAVREARRAYELDPFNLTGSGNYVDQLVLARQYDRAIEQVRRTLEIDPNYPFAHRTLGMLYTLTGRYADAERELRRVADAAPHIPDFRADLAYAVAMAGRREEARRILREVESLPDGPRKRDAAYSIGRAHVALGDLDSAFAWFDRADWRWPHRGNRFDPALAPLRADPRFARLSERVDREMGMR